MTIPTAVLAAFQSDLAAELERLGVPRKYAREVSGAPGGTLPPITDVTSAVRRLREVHLLRPGASAAIKRSAAEQAAVLRAAGYGKKNPFAFGGRRAAMSPGELQKQKIEDAKKMCEAGQFRAADKLARQSVGKYARQKGVKVVKLTGKRNGRRKNCVAAPARRANLRWEPISEPDLQELVAELIDATFFQDQHPAATPADWRRARKDAQRALDAVERGQGVRIARTSEGPYFQLGPVRTRNASKRRRRRNSAAGDDGLAEAGAAFERFQGRKPTRVIDVDTEVSVQPVLSKLGDLVSLTVLLLDGSKRKISFSPLDKVIAAQNPSGDQVYFVGGNQDVRPLLDDLGVDATKDLVELGQCVEIEYFTRKALDNFQPVRYYHQFGEETGVIPTLAFDQINCRLELVGGAYYIRPEGIRN